MDQSSPPRCLYKVKCILLFAHLGACAFSTLALTEAFSTPPVLGILFVYILAGVDYCSWSWGVFRTPIRKMIRVSFRTRCSCEKLRELPWWLKELLVAHGAAFEKQLSGYHCQASLYLLILRFGCNETLRNVPLLWSFPKNIVVKLLICLKFRWIPKLKHPRL